MTPRPTPPLLPPLYQRWMDEALRAPLGPETEATCQDCAMVLPTPARYGSFLPDVKCCGFTPDLPSFLVGALLADPDPSMDPGRGRVRAQLEGAHATPLGLFEPAVSRVLYDRAHAAFGRSRALRCPYFVARGSGGSCGIWPHRGAVCATYFCKVTRGARGKRLWNALKALLTVVEGELSRWCYLELMPEDHPVAPLLASRGASGAPGALSERDLDSLPSPAEAARLGGPHARDRDAYYRACAERVAPLDWSRVTALCGPWLGVHLRQVHQAQHDLERGVPAGVLRAGDVKVVDQNKRGVCLTTYAASDPRWVPRAVLRVMRAFDGRPTPEVLASLAEAGVTLDEDFLVKMVDFGMLHEQEA